MSGSTFRHTPSEILRNDAMAMGTVIARAVATSLYLMTALFAGTVDSQERHDWTIRDSILLRWFPAQPAQYSLGYVSPWNSSPVVISPNGEYILIIYQHGDLERDANAVTLSVYQRGALAVAVRDRDKRSALVAKVTYYSRANSVMARWESDSEGVVYRYERDRKEPDDKPEAICWRRLDVHRNVTVEIARAEYRPYLEGLRIPEIAFGSLDGAAILVRPSQKYYWSGGYPATDLREGIAGLGREGDSPPYFVESFVNGTKTASSESVQRMEILSVSPGGRFALLRSRNVGRDKDALAGSWVLVNLRTGALTQLDAAGPLDDLAESAVVWEGTSPEAMILSRAGKGSMTYTVSNFLSKADNGIWRMERILAPDVALPSVETARLTRSGPRLHLESSRHAGVQEWLEFAKAGDKWRQASAGATAVSEHRPENEPVRVELISSADEEPRIVAKTSDGELALTDPDPVLAGVYRAKMQPLTWREPDGAVVRGAVLWPRRFVEGTPLPLVVQIQHEVAFDKFAPDGSSTDGYAAQSFAARGMAVLEVPFVKNSRLPVDGTGSGEGRKIVERLRCAIGVLEQTGRIDPDRIGVMGHSRCGTQTLLSLIDSGNVRISAAIVLDSYQATLTNDLLALSAPNRNPLYGGNFWERKSAALAIDPILNLDRIHTPLLVTLQRFPESSTAALATMLVNGLRQLRKPGDVLFLPLADHSPARPRERAALLLAVTDWMCFWLRGEIPSCPERAARWAILRKQQDEVLKVPPPPRGKWVFVPDEEKEPRDGPLKKEK